MAAGITEIFTDGSSCKRCIILQRSRIASRGSYHNGIIHSTILTERIYNRSHGRTFLTDSHINTIYRIPCQEVGTLVDNRINRNGRLSCLTVTDNQLTLSTPNRNHGIHSFQSCLQRLVDRLTEDYSRRFAFQRHFIQITTN